MATKIEAAGAVLEAMSGGSVELGPVVETPQKASKPKAKTKAKAKVTPEAKAARKVKRLEEKEARKAARIAKREAAKAKKQEAEEKAKAKIGPKTAPVVYPINSKHETQDGGQIRIAKARVSYLVELPSGRKRWFAGLAVQAMLESSAAVEASEQEAEESEQTAA